MHLRHIAERAFRLRSLNKTSYPMLGWGHSLTPDETYEPERSLRNVAGVVSHRLKHHAERGGCRGDCTDTTPGTDALAEAWRPAFRLRDAIRMSQLTSDLGIHRTIPAIPALCLDSWQAPVHGLPGPCRAGRCRALPGRRPIPARESSSASSSRCTRPTSGWKARTCDSIGELCAALESMVDGYGRARTTRGDLP